MTQIVTRLPVLGTSVRTVMPELCGRGQMTRTTRQGCIRCKHPEKKPGNGDDRRRNRTRLGLVKARSRSDRGEIVLSFFIRDMLNPEEYVLLEVAADRLWGLGFYDTERSSLTIPGIPHHLSRFQDAC